ncbi:hypothetical protein Cme02nite_38190 [Catellatospora methionotrophica]|uniref:Uncharacterized protein n=1 Tax=Catellatospora methionotrophica TaxID=121620 RepID=A0A8J3LAL2_9ACTN|nr:hypothetical protein [Catellatospora methionotrophica]GIG15487.1 hypothetical protein Cme02nite_38190 [Catellatospora methionotrophica]
MYIVDVDVHGPLFDGRLAAAIRAGAADATWEIAKTGRGMLGVEYIKTFKNPTGYYESRTVAERVTPELAIIHDSDVVYGPWLEGVGSRNYPVTRFKGYHNWRRVTQALAKAAKPIAEQAIDRRLRAVT